MTVLDYHTPHQLLRDIQSLLTQNRNILVRWIKTHAGYRGNEEDDTLSKKAITEDVDSDSSACGEVGDPINYATYFPLTISWHIRIPSTSQWKVCGTKESRRIRI
ncbi:hypothetical protein AVEN_226331-1 [Araneus ventricosus]|uniref:RNase H type-1 domain-containing protein n=1 Tax=Araneus ventricosus TaxID=182803 RepID=A0A4Y2URK0_ARAVE|nr:hypothetical protein AVEN_226331-1 [Araneus ventricosus]